MEAIVIYYGGEKVEKISTTAFMLGLIQSNTF